MDGSKMIGDSYRIVKPLFQTKGYLYAQSNPLTTQSVASKITMPSPMQYSYLCNHAVRLRE